MTTRVARFTAFGLFLALFNPVLAQRRTYVQVVEQADVPTLGSECDPARTGILMVRDLGDRYYCNDAVSPAAWTLQPVGTEAEPLNAVNFGCVADGVTDDTACLQNLAATAKARARTSDPEVGGVAVYMPQGIYRITDTIWWGDDLTSSVGDVEVVYGDGQGTKILCEATDKPCFEVSGSHHKHHSDYWVVGDCTNVPAIGIFHARTCAGPGPGENCQSPPGIAASQGLFERVIVSGCFGLAAGYNNNTETLMLLHNLYQITGGNGRSAFISTRQLRSSEVPGGWATKGNVALDVHGSHNEVMFYGSAFWNHKSTLDVDDSCLEIDSFTMFRLRDNLFDFNADPTDQCDTSSPFDCRYSGNPCGQCSTSTYMTCAANTDCPSGETCGNKTPTSQTADCDGGVPMVRIRSRDNVNARMLMEGNLFHGQSALTFAPINVEFDTDECAPRSPFTCDLSGVDCGRCAGDGTTVCDVDGDCSGPGGPCKAASPNPHASCTLDNTHQYMTIEDNRYSHQRGAIKIGATANLISPELEAWRVDARAFAADLMDQSRVTVWREDTCSTASEPNTCSSSALQCGRCSDTCSVGSPFVCSKSGAVCGVCDNNSLQPCDTNTDCGVGTCVARSSADEACALTCDQDADCSGVGNTCDPDQVYCEPAVWYGRKMEGDTYTLDKANVKWTSRSDLRTDIRYQDTGKREQINTWYQELAVSDDSMGPFNPDGSGIHIIGDGVAGTITANSAADELVIEGDGTASRGLSILVDDAAFGNIYAGSPSTGADWFKIQFDPPGSRINWTVAGTLMGRWTNAAAGTKRIDFFDDLRLNATGDPSNADFTDIDLVGERTGNGDVGRLFFENCTGGPPCTSTDVAAITGRRFSADNSGQLAFFTNNAGAGLTKHLAIDNVGDVFVNTNLVIGTDPSVSEVCGADYGRIVWDDTINKLFQDLDCDGARTISDGEGYLGSLTVSEDEGIGPLAEAVAAVDLVFKPGLDVSCSATTCDVSLDYTEDAVDLGTGEVTGTLPLAKLTDNATSGLCLLSGGAGGDPNYAACPSGSVTVEEGDAGGFSASTIDFGVGFDVAENPGGEANVTFDAAECTAAANNTFARDQCLPAAVAYEDEANTFTSSPQTFDPTGNATVDLQLVGYRTASNNFFARILADNAADATTTVDAAIYFRRQDNDNDSEIQFFTIAGGTAAERIRIKKNNYLALGAGGFASGSGMCIAFNNVADPTANPGAVCLCTEGDRIYHDQDCDGNVEAPDQYLDNDQTKSVTIDNPTPTENKGIFYTDKALRALEAHCVLVGGTTPSVTYQLKFGSDRSATGTTAIEDVCDSTTSGVHETTFSDATIDADTWIWLATSAQSGSPTQMTVTLRYREGA